MTPTNNRAALLAAAHSLAADHGTAAVTLENVATAAGISKSGLIHHFRTKDALLLALVEHLIDRWEQPMLRALGRPPAEATAIERLRTYIRAAADPDHGPAAAELVVIVDAIPRPELLGAWHRFRDRWLDPPRLTPRQQAAVLGPDGLWLATACGTPPRDPDGTVAVLLTLLDPHGSDQPGSDQPEPDAQAEAAPDHDVAGHPDGDSSRGDRP